MSKTKNNKSNVLLIGPLPPPYAGPEIGTEKLLRSDLSKKFELSHINTTVRSSNAHSSYFFLLLQIGWLGLIFYVLLSISLIVGLLRERIGVIYKVSAILPLGSLLTIDFSATTAMYTSF